MNEIYYSTQGKILKRKNEEFIIAIWYDIPYYIAVPYEYEEFLLKIMKKEIKTEEIVSDLKNIKYKTLFSYLIKKGIISESPISNIIETKLEELYYISFQITEKCNLRCKHCYASAGDYFYDRDMNLDEINNLIKQLADIADLNECVPIITGGEPLIRQDILYILDAVLQKFRKVVLITNGTLLSDELIAELSKRKGLLLQISLDGANKKTHESIRGANTYDKVIASIKKCVDMGMKVSLSPICTDIFFEEIDEYVQLAYELKVHNIQFQPVQYIGRAQRNEMRRADGSKLIKKIVQLYSDEKYKKLISTGLESRSIIHVRNLNRLNRCGTGNGTMYISANGDVYACPNMKNENYRLGNVLSENVNDIYYKSPLYKKLREIDIDNNLHENCKQCEVKRFCGGGCRGVCLANTGNIYGKAIECVDKKAYFLEILWSVCKDNNFFKEESREWLVNRMY